jgi:hypothetical protein
MLRNEAELSATCGHVRCPMAYTPLIHLFGPLQFVFLSFLLCSLDTRYFRDTILSGRLRTLRIEGWWVDQENMEDLEHDFRPPRLLNFLDFLDRTSISAHTRR